MILKFDGWPWKIIGHLFYTTSSFVHHFNSIGEFNLELQSRNTQFTSKLAIFCPVWPLNLLDDLEKQKGHLFYAMLSFVHHFKAIGIFKLKLQSGNAQFGSKSAIFWLVWPWNLMDDFVKNNRAPILCCFKLCASFHSHQWTLTGVTVRKRPIWVKIDDFFLVVWPWNLTDDLEKQ